MLSPGGVPLNPNLSQNSVSELRGNQQSVSVLKGASQTEEVQRWRMQPRGLAPSLHSHQKYYKDLKAKLSQKHDSNLAAGARADSGKKHIPSRVKAIAYAVKNQVNSHRAMNLDIAAALTSTGGVFASGLLPFGSSLWVMSAGWQVMKDFHAGKGLKSENFLNLAAAICDLGGNVLAHAAQFLPVGAGLTWAACGAINVKNGVSSLVEALDEKHKVKGIEAFNTVLNVGDKAYADGAIKTMSDALKKDLSKTLLRAIGQIVLGLLGTLAGLSAVAATFLPGANLIVSLSSPAVWLVSAGLARMLAHHLSREQPNFITTGHAETHCNTPIKKTIDNSTPVAGDPPHLLLKKMSDVFSDKAPVNTLAGA
jgi:hypothetical protein